MNGEFNSMLHYGMPQRFGSLTGSMSGTSSPYYTLANQYIPRDYQGLLKWVDYILGQSPLITETLRKYSTYPVTEFIFESEDKQDRETYQKVFSKVKMKAMSGDIGMAYFAKGNAFISVYYKIKRFLTCPKCEADTAIEKIKYSLKKLDFEAKCPHCNYSGVMKRTDRHVKGHDGIRLILWNPMHIKVNHNSISGSTDYYYTIPRKIRNGILMGDPIYLNDSPWELIEAAVNARDFKFESGMIYHLKNISIGQHIEGIGMPPLISMYHLVFYEAMLRKANEAIASEYLMPLRILSPAPSSGQNDPIVNASMKSFVSNMERMIQKHRKDGNHIGFAPIPISYQPISGEGRTLLVNQEIQQAQQTILLGLGVSQELLSGTSNWTSSTVGLRMLSNMLNNYVGQLEEFYEWFGEKVSGFLGISEVKVTLAPFKLTDDSENKQIMLALYQSGKISDTTLMEALGIDFEKEQERMVKDKVAQAVLQTKIEAESELATFAEAKTITKMFKEAGDYKAGLQRAQQLAEQLVSVPEAQKKQLLQQLQAEDYALYLMTSKLVQETERQNTLALKQQQAEQLAAQGGQPPVEQETQEAPAAGSTEAAGEDKLQPPSFNEEAPV